MKGKDDERGEDGSDSIFDMNLGGIFQCNI